MQNKTKSNKPLAAAVTVASPVEPKPESSRARPRNPPSAVEAAAKPSVPSPGGRALTTTGTPSSASSVPLAAVPSPKAAQTVEVGFALFEPHAQRVSLCGGFNAWSPEATPMNRQNGGLWEASLALPPGRHEYKFVVDGQWLPDPNAPEQVFNAHGTLNSVVQVRT